MCHCERHVGKRHNSSQSAWKPDPKLQNLIVEKAAVFDFTWRNENALLGAGRNILGRSKETCTGAGHSGSDCVRLNSTLMTAGGFK